jgi:pimeloyl-ACP methyl ester carboxylesterase
LAGVRRLPAADDVSDNAVRFLEEFARIDVSDIVHRVPCPTPNIHSRRDARVPAAEAGELAALVPDSRLVLLESPNHLLTADEPAWPDRPACRASAPAPAVVRRKGFCGRSRYQSRGDLERRTYRRIAG